MADESTHVSFSQLSMILKCGEQYRRRYLLGEKIPPSGAQSRGWCGHKANEYNFRQKIESALDLPSEEVIQIFIDEWEKEKFNISFSADELQDKSASTVLGEFKDSGVALVKLYHKEQSPLVFPKSVEAEFTVEFQGDFPPLVGRIDRINVDEIIEEDKFVGKTPPEDDALTDVQLTCYNLAYQHLTGKQPAGLRKRFAVDLKIPKTVVRESPPRGQDDIARFLLRLQKAMEAIKAGMFLPAAGGVWWCSKKWCGYYSSCCVRP